jgi:acylaminoacyl-peptidase
LLASGFNLLVINFTGSAGFGPGFVEGLPGKIGDVDI